MCGSKQRAGGADGPAGRTVRPGGDLRPATDGQRVAAGRQPPGRPDAEALAEGVPA